LDDFLLVASEANSVVVAEIPDSDFNKVSIAIAGAEYQHVADAGLRRLVDCLRLFTDVPEVFPRSCWFYGELGGPSMRLETLRPVWDKWTLPVPEMPPASDIAHGLDGVQHHWPTLKELCRVDQLMACYVDPQKHKGYIDAGNAAMQRRAKALAVARYEEIPAAEREGPIITFGGKQAGLCFMGFQDAYLRAIRKLEDKGWSSGARLLRAFQIFANALRIENPHSYVALATCLEAILGLGKAEITFQLALRAGWLLEPSDFKARKSVFDEVRDLYDFRSQIVHGMPYSLDKMESNWDVLARRVRAIFQRVLSDPNLYALFAGTDTEACDNFLKSLSLGKPLGNSS
jgi:hypothetical protein